MPPRVRGERSTDPADGRAGIGSERSDSRELRCSESPSWSSFRFLRLLDPRLPNRGILSSSCPDPSASIAPFPSSAWRPARKLAEP